MQILRSIGDRTPPFLTPLLTLTIAPAADLNGRTEFEYQNLRSIITERLNPKLYGEKRSRLWTILSNAFERSKAQI